MDDKIKYVTILTNGCEEGGLESERLKYLFKEEYNLTDNFKEADLIIFYACGLTLKAENNSIKMIEDINKNKKESAEFIIWGCLPKINPKIMLNKDDVIIGPRDIKYFNKYLHSNTIDEINVNTYKTYKKNKLINIIDNMINKYPPPNTYFIRIARGCTGNCTFCSDRIAHGYINSEPIDKIIKQFKKGIKEKYIYFSLVGSDIGSYGYDINTDLSQLLYQIDNEAKNYKYKLLLQNVCPDHYKEIHENIKPFISSNKIYELGLPLQSASNRVLKIMGRKYNVDEWLNIVTEIKKINPSIHLTTHIMVGFPTEDENDFFMSLNILDKVDIDRIIVFKYSDRPTIASFNIKDKVTEEIKNHRYKILFKKARFKMLEQKIKRILKFY